MPSGTDYAGLLRRAYRLAQTSHDSSTQNAAIIVGRDGHEKISGVNRFARGVKHEPKSRFERPLKYEFFEHAERNAIYAAARAGISTDGLTMVCPWACCTNCARAIIEAGIVRLVTHMDANDRTPDRWKDSIAIALVMLEEAGVKHMQIEGFLDAPEVFHNGERWKP